MLNSSAVQNQVRILYSCYTHISREGEHFIPNHVFSYMVSGSQDMFLNGKTYSYAAGDFRFFAKNQLAKFVKRPPVDGGEFKTISVLLDQATLHQISEEMNLSATQAYKGENALTLKPNELFKNYIESLIPYLNSTNNALTQLKVKEAIMILLETNPALQSILFDFTAPGKIDLQAFMNAHYKFNVNLNRFAYLTGRSLASFKRDFEKIYGTSPNRWLQQKRLEDAYFLIKEKKQKITDVYLDVGFKDLSHFSFAFKKAYGIAPSKLV